MAEIDNTIALQAGKVPPPTDIIGPITSLAQLQYLQAHGALEGAQAQFQQGKTAAYNSFGQSRAGGASIQDALTQSNLPAYDPAGASSLVGIPNIERQNAAAAAYGSNPTPANAAGLGPEAYGKSVDAQKSQIGVQADLATQKGQIASELLGGIVKNQDGSETLPPEVRSDLIQRFKAVRSASGQPLDARTEQFLWSAPVDQLKPLALGMQQGGVAATDTPSVAGAKTGAVTAATSANTPLKVSPGEGVMLPNPAALPGTSMSSPAGAPPNASVNGSGSPGLSNNSYNNPGNIRDGTWAQSQPGYTGNYKGFAVFSSPLMGQAAMEKNLVSYARQGLTTPTQIAAKWAPAGDGANNPAAYANFVAGKLGITPDTPINMSDPAQRSALAVAMSQQENGAGYKGSGGAAVARLAGAMSPGSSAQSLGNTPALALAGNLSQPPFPSAGGGLPISAAAFTQPGRNPLVSPPPPQGTVAPIAPQPVQPPPGPPPGAVTAPINAPGMTVLSPAMSLQDKAAAEAVGHGMGETQVKQFADAKARYQTATTAQTKLGELQSSLDELPEKGGFLTPGPGATERLGVAKYINTALQSVGAKPFFDPQEIGNAENSQKLTGTLGFDMSKGLGSREAASITETAIKLNPGIENTSTGRRIISGALNAGMQRDRDFYQFISQNGNAPDADLKFNQTHPSAQYIQEAHELAGVPGQAIKRLQANPQLAPAFEQKYGSGLSRYFTGQ